MTSSAKKRTLISTIALLLVIALMAVYFFTIRDEHRKTVHESRTRILFDTVVRVSIEGSPDIDFSEIFTEIWNELTAWEQELNLYDSLSALSVANRSDTAVVLPERLSKAVIRGLDSIIPTGANFDIRIGEMTLLWDFAGSGSVPSPREISSAFEKMHRPIRMIGDTLHKSFMEPRLDLGGLGKGFACDAVFEILDTIDGIDRFIIDLGGNIRARSRDGSSFTIGVQSPKSADSLIGKFELASGEACASAGDYQRYFVIDGVKYHHILDPKTGQPAKKCSGVSIVARDGKTADIMSTALFVMGPEGGSEFLEYNSEIKAVFIDSTGMIIAGNLLIMPLTDEGK